jgi:hypothetical protein
VPERLITQHQRYAKVVEAMLCNSGVTLGSGKKGFGSSALQVNKKIFAMLSFEREFVVKLPKQRVDELVAAGSGERFDPGHGRTMKEWIALGLDADEDWLMLAKEAMEYVGRQT